MKVVYEDTIVEQIAAARSEAFKIGKKVKRIELTQEESDSYYALTGCDNIVLHAGVDIWVIE